MAAVGGDREDRTFGQSVLQACVWPALVVRDVVVIDEHVPRSHLDEHPRPEAVGRRVGVRRARDDALEECDRPGKRAAHTQSLDAPDRVVVDDEPRAAEAGVKEAGQWAKDRRVLGVYDKRPPSCEEEERTEEEREVADAREVPWTVEQGDALAFRSNYFFEL